MIVACVASRTSKYTTMIISTTPMVIILAARRGRTRDVAGATGIFKYQSNLFYKRCIEYSSSRKQHSHLRVYHTTIVCICVSECRIIVDPIYLDLGDFC